MCDFDPDSIGLNLPKEIALSPDAVHLYAIGTAAD